MPTFVGHNSRAYAAPNAGWVCIAHPVFMSESERAAWQRRLDADAQPFEQLDRRVFVPVDVPDSDAELFRDLPPAHPGSFSRSASKLGYQPGGRGEAGLVYDSYKNIGPYHVAVTHGGYWPQAGDGAGWAEDLDLEAVAVSRDRKQFPWRELPPALMSDIARDLHYLVGAW